MARLTDGSITALLAPFLAGGTLTPAVVGKLGLFVDLLVHWNSRTNLSAVRDPSEIMQRQVGESLFCAQLIPLNSTMLDFGSGAGFPGIPLQLLRSDLQVTLAESQGKKASFLREAVRTLQIPSRVWAGRVEDLPPESFDTVIMRAVDRSESMLPVATDRVKPGGSLVRFIGGLEAVQREGWTLDEDLSLPLTPGRIVRLQRS